MIYNKKNGYKILDFGFLENIFNRNVEFRNLLQIWYFHRRGTIILIKNVDDDDTFVKQWKGEQKRGGKLIAVISVP